MVGDISSASRSAAFLAERLWVREEGLAGVMVGGWRRNEREVSTGATRRYGEMVKGDGESGWFEGTGDRRGRGGEESVHGESLWLGGYEEGDELDGSYNRIVLVNRDSVYKVQIIQDE